MKKKIILSAGGTGGHLFPAQAVADQLKGCEILFVGSNLSKNKYFDREKYPFQEIQAGPLTLRGSKKILLGYLQSLRLLEKWQPDMVIGFGSYYTFPCLLAALTKKIPFALHEQNSIPGKVNRLFSKKAAFTAITFPESRTFLKGNTVEVQFPLRFPHKNIEKRHSLAYFGLDASKQTLLVFGGSQGGRGINHLLVALAKDLPKKMQILHFTGNSLAKEEAQREYALHGLQAVVKEFEPCMHEAWNVADIAICRAGASTVNEAIVWEVPCIFIPFPHATDRHQDKNAEHFVYTVKGGEMLFEETLDKGRVLTLLETLDLAHLKANIRLYKQNHHQLKLEDLL